MAGKRVAMKDARMGEKMAIVMVMELDELLE